MRFSDIKSDYAALWGSCLVRPERLADVDSAVRQILQNRRRYEECQRQSGVWWPVIACIHSLEASFSFQGHLHNGDSLARRTVQVPAGRPERGNPPFTWEESAADALAMKRWILQEVGDLNTPEECLYFLEIYNGLGYRQGAGQATTPPARSPYLWSMTSNYVKGKYIADGRFDRNAVSEQVGAAAILKRLAQQGVIGFGEPGSGKVDLPSATERPFVAAPVPLGFARTLQHGQQGVDVYRLLCALMGLGFLKKADKVTDVFNDVVHDAVAWFQSSVMRDHPDGLVGPNTKAALEQALERARAPKPPTAGPSGDPKLATLVDTGERHTGAWSGLRKLLLCIGDETFSVASGVASAQALRLPVDPNSYPGCLEPLPQGEYRIGSLEWADGRDNYNASWGPGLGPVKSAIVATFPDDRDAFYFHLDSNIQGSPGSAGCVSFFGNSDLKRWVAAMRKWDPERLSVRWGL